MSKKMKKVQAELPIRKKSQKNQRKRRKNPTRAKDCIEIAEKKRASAPQKKNLEYAEATVCVDENADFSKIQNFCAISMYSLSRCKHGSQSFKHLSEWVSPNIFGPKCPAPIV
jgi:hypothetical protein